MRTSIFHSRLRAVPRSRWPNAVPVNSATPPTAPFNIYTKYVYYNGCHLCLPDWLFCVAGESINLFELTDGPKHLFSSCAFASVRFASFFCFLLSLASFCTFWTRWMCLASGKWRVATGACGKCLWSAAMLNGETQTQRDSPTHAHRNQMMLARPTSSVRSGLSSSVAAPHVACGCTGSCSLQLHCCCCCCSCCKFRNDVRFVWLSMTTIYVLYIHDMCVAWVAHEFISWTMFCETKICWF